MGQSLTAIRWEYFKFKAAFKVEVDEREVYDDIEKLKFLLDAVEGSA